MNAVTVIAPAGDGRLNGVAAYVLDADSEATLRRAAAHLALPGFELHHGNVDAAMRDLKAKRSPALLFVDVCDTDMVADAMQRLSEVCEPQLQVVVIGRENDVGLYRELLAMGVADYIFKPLTTQLVEKLMRQLTTTAAARPAAAARQGKLVVVSGARGGVGTSSVACNVASYLAEKAERRVVLVDLDTSAGAQALMLGVEPNAGLAEALDSPSRIDDLFVERATIAVGARLDLLASEQPIDRAAPIKLEASETLIERLRKKYFYVIVDLPRGLGPVADALVAAADLRLLVTEATLIGARDAGRTPPIAGRRTIVVHNKAGRPGDLGDGDFAAALLRAPDVALPYHPRAFGVGVNLGTPAWRSGGPVEAAVARLAMELTGRSGAIKPPTLLDRILKR